MRVLVVDDEPAIRRALRTGLSALGHEVVQLGDGVSALQTMACEHFDAVILDLGLPDMDGVAVIQTLRGWSKVPVIVLSVREGQQDKVAALNAGADDYVAKPFAMAELVARIGAVVRRAEPVHTPAILRYGALSFDRARGLVMLGEERVPLTKTELRLLEALVSNPLKLLTHQWLLRQVWGQGYGHQSQYLRVYVRRLRSKLGDDPTGPRWIATEPGVGYRWIAPPTPAPQDRGSGLPEFSVEPPGAGRGRRRSMDEL
ncbi:MAG: response regulator transcription factor [Actinomycetota bacterium]